MDRFGNPRAVGAVPRAAAMRNAPGALAVPGLACRLLRAGMAR